MKERMLRITGWRIGLALYVTLIASLAWAQEKKPESDPETLKKLAEAGFLADPQALGKIATAGQPLGRWKEGLMFDGIPASGAESSANWFPAPRMSSR